jgi:uncharacterized protein
MNPLKILMIFTGTVSLGLGIIGIVIPGLPTTPFLILSAGLYMRSSEKLYTKLTENKWVGPYLSRYYKNKGLLKREKISALVLMWVMIAFSCLFFISSIYAIAALMVVGLTGTFVMGYLIPTVNRKDPQG